MGLSVCLVAPENVDVWPNEGFIDMPPNEVCFWMLVGSMIVSGTC